MTDARSQRIAALTAAAKAKSHTKTHTTERAIRALVKRGEPVTFQAVQREAGVSHSFLYTHPELRAQMFDPPAPHPRHPQTPRAPSLRP